MDMFLSLFLSTVITLSSEMPRSSFMYFYNYAQSESKVTALFFQKGIHNVYFKIPPKRNTNILFL